MPLLVSMTDIKSVLENPAWIMFGITAGIGLLGLFALMVIYPMSRD